MQDTVRDHAGCPEVVDFLEQKDELVTTQTGQRVTDAQTAFQTARRLDEYEVAGFVAEAVVDDFETVEVQENNCPEVFVGIPFVCHVIEPIHQEGTIREAGEFVVEGREGKPLFDFDATDDLALKRHFIGQVARHRTGRRDHQRRGTHHGEKHAGENRDLTLDQRVDPAVQDIGHGANRRIVQHETGRERGSLTRR